jgi:hypothetical protein
MRTTSLKRAFIAIAATAAASVAASGGGQVGEEGGVACLPVTTTPIDLDEVTPLGFSAGELLDATMGTRSAGVVWVSGGDTAMTIELSYEDGSAEFQERDWVGDHNGTLEAIGVDCPDVIQIAARVEVTTADGALDESWDVVALADSATRLSFSRRLEDLNGSLAIEDFAPAGDWTSIRALIDLAIDAGGLSGRISGQATGESGDVAFAEGFEIATITPDTD